MGLCLPCSPTNGNRESAQSHRLTAYIHEYVGEPSNPYWHLMINRPNYGPSNDLEKLGSSPGGTTRKAYRR